MIDGVKLTPLKQIEDERGKVMHMLREDSPVFQRFGEIYFSCTYPGAIKAWHLHTKMTLNCAVVHGELKLVLYDNRAESPTCGVVQEVFLSPTNYYLITVPPFIWNGFTNLGIETAIMANCATITHNPIEKQRKDFNDPSIPYTW